MCCSNVRLSGRTCWTSAWRRELPSSKSKHKSRKCSCFEFLCDHIELLADTMMKSKSYGEHSVEWIQKPLGWSSGQLSIDRNSLLVDILLHLHKCLSSEPYDRTAAMSQASNRDRLRRKKSVDQKSKCLQKSDACHGSIADTVRNEPHAPSHMLLALAATGLSSPTPQKQKIWQKKCWSSMVR